MIGLRHQNIRLELERNGFINVEAHRERNDLFAVRTIEVEVLFFIEKIGITAC